MAPSALEAAPVFFNAYKFHRLCPLIHLMGSISGICYVYTARRQLLNVAGSGSLSAGLGPGWKGFSQGLVETLPQWAPSARRTSAKFTLLVRTKTAQKIVD